MLLRKSESQGVSGLFWCWLERKSSEEEERRKRVEDRELTNSQSVVPIALPIPCRISPSKEG